MSRAYLALGSNLGDRKGYLDRAVEALRQEPSVRVGAVSSYHETQPVGGPPGQENYLNAALVLETELEPLALLRLLLKIEQSQGRVRDERFGPRTLDLDLLLFDNQIREDPELSLPHPRMHERAFVLAPLVEIAAGVVHPKLGRTMQELLSDLLGKPLAGLRALVTGSTTGIGRAMALELARSGADVMMHGRRPVEEAQTVLHRVASLGRRVAYVRADLRNPESLERLVETAWAQWNGLDIWINNAGADTLTGEMARWSFERKLQELLAVDVTATMLLSRSVGRRMQQAGIGVIVNVGWDQADTGMEGDSGELFASAKAAVMAFSKSLALSLAPAVRVNCLAPGWIKTAWGEQASQYWQERVARQTPLGRWGTPEDVAAAAAWLVSPAARFVTGQVVRVNGGAVR